MTAIPFNSDFRVYTDRSQCNRFDVSYMADEELLVVSTTDLLRSRGPGGYDQEHRDFLEPLQGATLLLKRTPDLGPGWWRVTHVETYDELRPDHQNPRGA